MSVLWILATILAHASALVRARRRFLAARHVLMRAEARLRQSIWSPSADPVLVEDIRALLRRHGLADARFSEAMFPRLGGDTLLSEGISTADPAVQGKLRIALFRVYGAESAIYAEARSLDTLVWRFCMGPLALLGGDPRAARPALRLALALIWLCALYWVVLPRLP
jgi:hypothetical protein